MKTDKNLLRVFIRGFCGELSRLLNLMLACLMIGFGLTVGAYAGWVYIVLYCGGLIK